MAVFIASVLWTVILFIAVLQLGEVAVDKFDQWYWMILFGVVIMVFITPAVVKRIVKQK